MGVAPVAGAVGIPSASADGMNATKAQAISASTAIAAMRRLPLFVLFIIAFIGTHDESFLNGVKQTKTVPITIEYGPESI